MFAFLDRCQTAWGELGAVSRLLSAADARLVDAAVSADYGVSSACLMEQAGMAVAMLAETMSERGQPVLVLVGGGQNGGDGWVAARILHARGVAVRVIDFAAGKRLPPEAETNRSAAVSAGVPVDRPDAFLRAERLGPLLIIDALFGSGLVAGRPLPADVAAAIERVDRLATGGARVLAVDLPSGVDATTGALAEPCLRADRALAFIRAKIGQCSHPGSACQTSVALEPLGVTAAMLKAILPGPGVYLAGAASVAALLPPFQVDRHKGQGGRAALIGGSRDMPGAAVLAAKAMAMTGAGYVSLICDPSLRGDYLGVLPEALYPAAPSAEWLTGQDAVAYGPGLGPAPAVALSDVISAATRLVIDADGLNRLAEMPDWRTRLAARRTPAVLTPHVGEFRRLADYAAHDRVGSAVRLADASGAIVVLKGHSSVIAAPDGNAVLVQAGNPGLAKGGSGDVLTGIIAGLLAGGLPPFSAAAAGVYVHGAAADAAALLCGERALLPQDVIASLPSVWRRLAADTEPSQADCTTQA